MTEITRPAMTDDNGTFTSGTVVNKDFIDDICDQIDTQVHSSTNPTVLPKTITDEVILARGSKASLDDRLDVSLAADGTLAVSFSNVSGGLRVGFAGSAPADTVEVGDASFKLDYTQGGAGNPGLRFDANDAFLYVRASDLYEWYIASVEELRLSSGGLQVTNGLLVGFFGTPADDAIQIGDTAMELGYGGGTDPYFYFDTNDGIVFTRSTNLIRHLIGSVASGTASAFGWSGKKGGDVASAAAIVPTGNLFHVTGTTTITSITSTGVPNGTVITLIFDDVLTFTDGSNLVLAGNFVTTANDTITLQYDGTNWYEMCRSVN